MATLQETGRPTKGGPARPGSRCRPDCQAGEGWRGAAAAAAVPGLVVVAGATALAFLGARFLPGVNPATLAVILGALLANTGMHTDRLRPGTHVAGHRLLRIAVVLLGFQLSASTLRAIGLPGAALVLGTVAVTFTGLLVLGRLFGLPLARSLLLATGYSICGASAVAAVRHTVDADEDDVAVAVALVTLCGSLAIFVLPALRGSLHLNPVQFGAWVGASVHDVGQTVATAQVVPGALTVAMVVKLSRVALLLPLVTALGMRARRQALPGATAQRPPVLPLFLVGFVLAAAANSSGLVPTPALHDLAQVQHVALVAALVGLGTGIHRRVLARAGGRVLIVGLVGWVLVAGTALVAVHLTGISAG
ncbi:MAG TPA: putative sulfate exporter family transporter [Sporichthyaceae bacterium]|nr:putative sulfate exporter family transporter [Sporichthyaceae bacterium]